MLLSNLLLSTSWIKDFLDAVDSIVLESSLLVLLIGIGIYLTIHLKFLKVSKLPLALKYVFVKMKK